jgi:hypothetical protein
VVATDSWYLIGYLTRPVALVVEIKEKAIINVMGDKIFSIAKRIV